MKHEFDWELLRDYPDDRTRQKALEKIVKDFQQQTDPDHFRYMLALNKLMEIKGIGSPDIQVKMAKYRRERASSELGVEYHVFHMFTINEYPIVNEYLFTSELKMRRIHQLK